MYFAAEGDLCPGASIAAKSPRSQPVSLLEPLLKRLHHCESSLCPFQMCMNLLQLRSVFLKGLRTIPLNCTQYLWPNSISLPPSLSVSLETTPHLALIHPLKPSQLCIHGDGVPFFPPQFSSVQFSSVTQSCLTFCNPIDCSTPGLPVHHQLLEFTQTHVH